MADRVGDVDVAVCANVAYNVADLGPFVEALTTVASHRVVLELDRGAPSGPALAALAALLGHLPSKSPDMGRRPGGGP